MSEELREITTTPRGGSGDDGISSGAIAAIVAVVVVVLLTLVIVLIIFLVYKKRNKTSYDVYRKSRHDGDDHVADIALDNKTYIAAQEISYSHIEQMISTEPEHSKMVDQKSADDGMVTMNPDADHDDSETHL